MNEDKNENKNPEWTQQPLPNIYLRLEGILYQASWVIEQEILRQKKKVESVKTILEQDLSQRK
jgi:hypothetical protein